MATTQQTFDFVIRAIDRATSPMRAIANAVMGVGKAAEHAAHGTAHVAASAGHAGHAVAEVARNAHGVEGVAKAAEHVKAGMEGAAQAAHAAGHAAGEVTAHNRGFMALVGHVHLLHHHFGELNLAVGEAGHSVTEFLPMLGALGAAGSLVGLFEITEHVSEMRSEFLKAATEIGILPKQLGALNMAAKMSDVGVDVLDKGLVKLDRTMALAAAGKNKDVAGLFSHLGIALRDSTGHIRSVADVMPQLADAFQHTTDPALRVRAAMALFGKAGADMIPMLVGGSEQLKEFADIAAQVNYAPSKEEGEGLEEFHRSWIKLTAAVSGFQNEIGAKLAPVLQPVLELATEWVTANRDWIATGIAAKVGELASWVRALDLQAVMEQTREWANGLMDLSGHVGGVTTMIGAATLVLGSPLLSAMSSVIKIVGSLGRAFVWLSSLLWANPILIGVAALGVAGYELYANWDWVKEKMGQVFEWFSHQSVWVQDLITIVAPFIGLPLSIIEHWDPIKAFFVDLWDNIKAVFQGALGYIQPIIDHITSLADSLSHTLIGKHVLGIDTGAGPLAGELEQSGQPALPAPFPTPYREGAPQAGAPAAPATAPADGKVHVQVDINGLPPGSNARAQSSGAAQTPDLNVGYAYPIAAY